MKIFKFMIVALVAMCGFASCSEDCDHDFIEVDYSADLVGTWTCLEADLAQAFVFNADGTATTTGVENGKYWENVNVTWKLKNNKLTLSYGDNTSETLINIVSGKILSIADKNGDNRRTFQYCANDLSEEIVGMWVCTQSTAFDQEMSVNTYQEDGKALFTGYTPDVNGYKANLESTYKVIGDLLIQMYYVNEDAQYITLRLNYSPNATGMGDILTITSITTQEGQAVEQYASLLRINQSLNLPNQKYNYIKTYVSNVKGEDKDIDFMGYTFNFAKMDGSGLDKMLKSLLFAVEFPDANTLGYSYQMNGNKETYNSPIVVEGNKMTIKMSAKVPTLKDVVLYVFQDADCSQMHFYMHKTAFVSFYTNMQAMLMAATNEQFDITNAEAVNAIYDNINNAVETINVSLVMSK